MISGNAAAGERSATRAVDGLKTLTVAALPGVGRVCEANLSVAILKRGAA